MALYRFRITFEDYDDVIREIDVKSNQTFEIFTGQSTNQQVTIPSILHHSISNDQWTKGEEITFMPNQKRIDRGVALMDKVKLLSYIDDPHQKFYYTFNFDRPFDFHVELMKIILDDAPGVSYPAVIKSAGEAPKQFGNVIAPPASAATADEFDFLNELAFDDEETSDFSEVDETGEITEKKTGDEEEDDEFGAEFSDDDGFEDHEKLPDGDDY